MAHGARVGSTGSSGRNGRLPSDISDRDRDALRRLGKKPVLKRHFGFISIFGFASTILITWEATIKIGLNYGIKNGGPAGLIIQYLCVWVAITLSFVTITEMASMAPVSGGQYHWVSILSPPEVHNFLSYVTGWMTICGWQATTASVAYVAGSLIQDMITAANAAYTSQTWHLVLLTWAVIALAALANVRGGTWLPRLEASFLLLHIFGFLAIIITLLTLSPKRNDYFVFSTFLNGGNFPTQSLSTAVGFSGMIWVFIGADGAIHMSEEIENASVVVPRSIVTTYITNGMAGFAMLLAILFSIQDLNAVLNAPSFPFIQIFSSATHSNEATAVMIAIIAAMQLVCTASCLTATSRQLWSFARDHGVPGWRLLSRVELKTSVPIYAVGLTVLISVLLSLINFGSSAVFNDLLSLAIAGLYSSYLLATSLLLYRRLNNSISTYSRSDKTLTNTVGAKLTWGPWHVPGTAGLVLNVLVCCFLAIAVFLSFWPITFDVTPSTMNYNVLIWGAVIIFSLFYYHIQGRKEYSGPIIDDDNESVSNSIQMVPMSKKGVFRSVDYS